MKKNAAPSGALLVAAGIFLSRISGLVRQKVFAHYFGSSDAGDAFYAALKIPNFLQNLFGEGVLSASFIPVYAGLLARGEREEAAAWPRRRLILVVCDFSSGASRRDRRAIFHRPDRARFSRRKET